MDEEKDDIVRMNRGDDEFERRLDDIEDRVKDLENHRAWIVGKIESLLETLKEVSDSVKDLNIKIDKSLGRRLDAWEKFKVGAIVAIITWLLNLIDSGGV